MQDDQETPECAACEQHVGIANPVYLYVKGNYFFSPSLGCEVFVLSQEVGISPFQLPNGQTAYVVDVRPNADATRVVHRSCADRGLELVAEEYAEYTMPYELSEE